MIIEILKIIVPILTAIIGLFTNKKIESRSIKKAQIFKLIRNEYRVNVKCCGLRFESA